MSQVDLFLESINRSGSSVAKMKVAIILLLTSLVAAKPTVYFIRHGEKPDDGNGLNTQGLQRAQCLRTGFGASSGYQIGHIMAQTPQSGTAHLTPSPEIFGV